MTCGDVTDPMWRKKSSSQFSLRHDRRESHERQAACVDRIDVISANV
jgi:hypothetical protein